MLKIAPDLGVGNGLRPQWISHDAQVVDDYRKDRYVHRRVTARMAKFIIDAGSATLARAPHWTTPTLLMYAGSDQVVNPEGSRRFAANSPTQVVTAQCFEHMYHEIFNEIEAEPVFDALHKWLDARF
jgi:alpha-beta hydrolase superfamily lysophospholipase